MDVFNDTDGVSRMNSSAMQLMDFKKVFVHITVMGQSNEASRVYDVTYFKGTIDECNIARGVVGNFIIKMITENLEEYTNFRYVCPQKKGFYYFTNFPAPNDKNFPPFLYGKGGSWEVVAVVRAKVENSKAMVHVITMKIYGVTRNNA